MKENLKSYLQFIAVFVLCTLANFYLYPNIVNETTDADNATISTNLSSHISNLGLQDYATFTTGSENGNRNLIFDIVDPQEIEESENHLNDNLRFEIGFESNFSNIQYLENFTYLRIERLLRNRYNSNKISSDLHDRLEVYII